MTKKVKFIRVMQLPYSELNIGDWFEINGEVFKREKITKEKIEKLWPNNSHKIMNQSVWLLQTIK